MPSDCSSVYGRCIRAECYCDPGYFYTQDWPRGPHSAPSCLVLGKEIWGPTYVISTVCECTVFALLFLWCAAQCVRLYWAEADRIQKLIHGFGLLALGLRVSFLVAEFYSIQSYDQRDYWQQFFATIAPYLYSSFFPLAASGFLCIYHYWLRFIAAIDDALDVAQWRSPICAIPVLLFVELVRDCICMSEIVPAVVPVVNGFYFVLLALVDVVVAASGLVVAHRLRKRVNAWLPSNSRLFKIVACTVAVSITSVLFLFLSIVQSMVGRFCVWPFLFGRVIGSMLEVVYMVVIFVIAGHVQQQTRNSSALEMEGGNGSECSIGSLRFSFSGEVIHFQS